jgi:hypothetical protein
MRVTVLLIAAILLILISANKSDATWFTPAGQCQGSQGEITSTCAWGDYDNDGEQDLFVGTGSDMVCHLWHNTTSGFTDVGGSISGINYDKEIVASCWGDYNNDGLLDLFTASAVINDTDEKCLIYQNQGPNENGNYTFIPISDPRINDAPSNPSGASRREVTSPAAV